MSLTLNGGSTKSYIWKYLNISYRMGSKAIKSIECFGCFRHSDFQVRNDPGNEENYMITYFLTFKLYDYIFQNVLNLL